MNPTILGSNQEILTRFIIYYSLRLLAYEHYSVIALCGVWGIEQIKERSNQFYKGNLLPLNVSELCLSIVLPNDLQPHLLR